MSGDIFVDDIRATGTPFRIGGALSEAFSVMGRQFGKFVLLALVPMSGLLAFTLLLGSGVLKVQTVSFGYMGALIALLTFILQTVAQATTLYGAFQEMRDQPFTIGQSLAIGLGRALPVIGVALSSTLLIYLGAIFLFVPD